MSLIKRLLIVCLFIFPVCILALPEDNREKIYISADTSTYNYKTGTNVFTGHVQVKQGSRQILADKLITKSNLKHELQEILAYGETNLAQYSTLSKVDGIPIKAQAKIIKYYPMNKSMILEDTVLITQGENHFAGERIFYNMVAETITVPATKNSRAVLVYDPNQRGSS